MANKTQKAIRLLASVALLLVLNVGERSWLPPSGLNTAMKLLESRPAKAILPPVLADHLA